MLKGFINWFYWSSGGREKSLRLGANSLAQTHNFTVLALLKKPDATEHSLIIENDESVFDARVVTFFQEWRLLWAPGSSAGDYFWGREHCALLARFVKPRPLVVIEESGSAFAMVGARHEILSSDVYRFGYTASAELDACSFLVWGGSLSRLVRGVRGGRAGWSRS